MQQLDKKTVKSFAQQIQELLARAAEEHAAIAPR
jgi:hypothetical protein